MSFIFSEMLIQQKVKQNRCNHKKKLKNLFKKAKQTEGMAVEPTTYGKWVKDKCDIDKK